MNDYPYRECQCGQQIHVGGRSLCDDCLNRQQNNGLVNSPVAGETMRERYAGIALLGMLVHSTRYKPRDGAPENWHDAISEEAWQIADAMLKAGNA